jgi:transposase-like protein
MPPVDRRNPIRAKSSESTINLVEFFREYPDDETCLNYLWRERFSADGEHAYCERCQQERTFKRYETSDKRPAWYCQACGFRIHPLKGTIFEKSSTSLQLWFFAMYLMAATRCGISAKQLERELGVTYKTAWRMFNLIRTQLMQQDDTPLSGEVEVDETYMRGRMRQSERLSRAAKGIHPMNHHREGTAIVYGAVERAGRVRATTIPDSRARTLLGQTHEFVLPGSLVYTDDWLPYRNLSKIGYTHRRINHRARVYVEGDTHTQTIEGFFGLVKNAIKGVHHGVSHKWLQGYLNEYVWRWNRREEPWLIFHDLVRAAATDRVG